MKFMIHLFSLMLMLGVTANIATASTSTLTETNEVEGPHGGKLLTSDNFDIEITIYETGIPPEMRVYAYSDGQAIMPTDFQLTVSLERLGEVTDNLTFVPENDYFVSEQEIYEPHSYTVNVSASYQNNQVQWRYENFEGRTELSNRVIEAAGITTAEVEPKNLVFKETMFGIVAPVNSLQRGVSAQYPGVITEVLVDIGDAVEHDQPLARIRNAASGSIYTLFSPISGEVTERNANIGEVANSQQLFEITNLSKVWIELSAFPETIEQLSVGQSVNVYDLHQHLQATSEITYIAPKMTGGHIARARTVIDNSEGHWRPGMHVKADVTTHQIKAAQAVAKRALQTFRERPVVFVRVGNTFEVRMLELGRDDGEFVEVLDGIEPGASYVVDNSYLLKADVLKDGAAHDH